MAPSTMSLLLPRATILEVVTNTATDVVDIGPSKGRISAATQLSTRQPVPTAVQTALRALEGAEVKVIEL
jgi:hypothetical protein